jgi:hypothetical protein
MHTSLSAQLAQLDLSHLSVERPTQGTDLAPPEPEAIQHTLSAVWSDLFALFADTNLEAEGEELAWGLVNLFHRAATKRASQIDRATDEIRLLIATADGSEVNASELETQVERAQAAEAAMITLEELRETAAQLYCQETGSSWRPAGGSRLSHDANVTSAVVQGRDYLAARAASKRQARMPVGTPVVFAGGRLQFATNEDAKQLADNVWTTLDKVREHVAEMLLVHGGDGKGVDRLAAAWAEARKVPQLTFALETRLGQRAGFKRNEQMLSLNPRYVVAFPGTGVLERLVIQAKERRIGVVDRRGPLGVNPKLAARLAA